MQAQNTHSRILYRIKVFKYIKRLNWKKLTILFTKLNAAQNEVTWAIFSGICFCGDYSTVILFV